MLVSGLLALIISLTPLREYVINAIPRNLKLAVSAGIGLFLFIIALEQAKVVVDHPATLVTLGDLKQWPAILALAGFALIAALNARNVLGATLIGILVVTLIGIPLGLVKYSGVVSLPPSLAPTFLQLDFSRVFETTALVVIFTLLLVDFFDTAGTLIGVAHRAKLLDKDGKLPRMRQALVADSSATVIGSLLGTSNTTSYIESASGALAGGRTGLTGVVVAALFLLALFFSPLAGMIPAYASAAALLYVAVVMARGPSRDGVGRSHGIGARGGRRGLDAAHLLDRDRHRPRLHHLRGDQAHRRQGRRCIARRAGTGGAVRDQVRGGII